MWSSLSNNLLPYHKIRFFDKQLTALLKGRDLHPSSIHHATNIKNLSLPQSILNKTFEKKTHDKYTLSKDINHFKREKGQGKYIPNEN